MAGHRNCLRAAGIGIGVVTALAVWVSPGLAATANGALPVSVAQRHMAQHRAAQHHSAHAVKYYIVRPLYHGQQEFLYEIAQRFLGNGGLYPAIFNLNKGRLQPDGGRLTDPTQIDEGWILELPPSAHGSGLHVGPLPVVKPMTAAPRPTSAANAAKAAKPKTALAAHSRARLPMIIVAVLAVLATAVGALSGARLALRRRANRPSFPPARPSFYAGPAGLPDPADLPGLPDPAGLAILPDPAGPLPAADVAWEPARSDPRATAGAPHPAHSNPAPSPVLLEPAPAALEPEPLDTAPWWGYNRE